jgi:uncharacterized protein with GYD domain
MQWSRGGAVREHVYTLGKYDIVMVTEFPTMTEAGAAQLASLATSTKTMRLTDEEMSGITSRGG